MQSEEIHTWGHNQTLMIWCELAYHQDLQTRHLSKSQSPLKEIVETQKQTILAKIAVSELSHSSHGKHELFNKAMNTFPFGIGLDQRVPIEPLSIFP